jgi:flagellar export protein FliJ
MLRLRQSEERRELLRLGALATRLAYLRQAQQTAHQERLEAVERLNEQMQGGTSAVEYEFDLAVLARQAQREQDLAQQVRSADQRYALQQAAFREAQKNRKVLDNLRERGLEAYRREQEKNEQKQTDDLFGMRLGLRD